MPKDLASSAVGNVQIQATPSSTRPQSNSFGKKGGGRASQAYSPTGDPPIFYTAIKIFAISKVDDKSQTFDCHFRLFVEWREERLPEGVRRWPKLKLLNQVAESSMKDPDAVREPELDVKSGWWELKRDFNGTFSCDFDLHVFPFDNQDLTLQVSCCGLSLP